jgi:hypothetical protein
MRLLEGIMYLDQRTPELLLPGDVIKVFDIIKLIACRALLISSALVL